MNYETWFPTIIAYEDNLSFSNDIIINYTQELIDASSGREMTNVGGWQSNDLDISNVNLTEVVNIIQNKLDEYVYNSNWNIKLHLDNLWINVNYKDSYNFPHIHPKSILSGVLYIKTPENCGNIVFENPNNLLVSSYFDFNSSKKSDSVINSFISYKAISNRIVIFPSWLKHNVEKNLSNESRISISFNSRYTRIEQSDRSSAG